MLKWFIEYLVKDLDVQPGTAATIILSLFTFSLGFLITWTAAALSKWIKKIKYKKSLSIIIRSFLNSCKTQYLILEKFSSQKGYLHDEGYTIQIKSNFAQNYLSNIDVKVFIENYSSLFKRNRAQEISDLLELVEAVRMAKQTSQDQMKSFYPTYEENLKKYNENIDSLRKLQDDLALEYNGKEIGKDIERDIAEYVYSIVSTFTQWKLNGGSISIEVTNTEIITPLFDRALSIPPNIISRKVIENCLQCRIAVENIRNVQRYMKDEVAALENAHKEAYEKGIKIISKW